MGNLRKPDNFELYDEGIMSNFDHEIEHDVANKIKGKKLYSTYSGWNFCGYVWWQNNEWHCEVWTYNSYAETFSGTLEDIMSDVSFEYGSE